MLENKCLGYTMKKKKIQERIEKILSKFLAGFVEHCAEFLSAYLSFGDIQEYYFSEKQTYFT